MTYDEAQAAIQSSLKQGLLAEYDSELYLLKELDQVKNPQIQWIASWLAGDNFGKVEKETNPYLPEPPADGKHIFINDDYRCSRCGVYNRDQPENPGFYEPCQGRWAHSSKFRYAAEERWKEEQAPKPVDREMVDWLTQQACFAADTVAMENRTQLHLTGAQGTRRIVERVIEFLIGNGLVEVSISKDQGVWMQIDPPYSPKKIEAKP